MWCQVHSSHISSFYIQQPHTDTPIFSDSTLVKLSPRLPGKYSNLMSSDICIIIELLSLPLLGDSKNHLIFSDGTLVFFFVRSDLLFFSLSFFPPVGFAPPQLFIYSFICYECTFENLSTAQIVRL